VGLVLLSDAAIAAVDELARRVGCAIVLAADTLRSMPTVGSVGALARGGGSMRLLDRTRSAW
jgi:hypothetical protein